MQFQTTSRQLPTPGLSKPALLAVGLLHLGLLWGLLQLSPVQRKVQEVREVVV